MLYSIFQISFIIWGLYTTGVSIYYLLRAHSVATKSTTQFNVILRWLYKGTLDSVINTFIKDKCDNHQTYAIVCDYIRSTGYYNLRLLEEGTISCEIAVSDLIGRVDKFVKEWTKHQYISTNRLIDMWKNAAAYQLSYDPDPISPSILNHNENRESASD